jgi:hypothetical protein
MRLSVRAVEVLSEIRRRGGSVTLSVLTSHFERSIAVDDLDALLHALRRACLIAIISEPHGDVIRISPEGMATLHQQATDDVIRKQRGIRRE